MILWAGVQGELTGQHVSVYLSPVGALGSVGCTLHRASPSTSIPFCLMASPHGLGLTQGSEVSANPSSPPPPFFPFLSPKRQEVDLSGELVLHLKLGQDCFHLIYPRVHRTCTNAREGARFCLLSRTQHSPGRGFTWEMRTDNGTISVQSSLSCSSHLNELTTSLFQRCYKLLHPVYDTSISFPVVTHAETMHSLYKRQMCGQICVPSKLLN